MKSATIVILYFLIGGHCAFAQPDSAFLTRATQLLDKQPAMEKVYLHLNKKAYGFGDTVWYKAYTVIGQHHQLSALSGVLYVELISPKDSLVTRQILPIVSGVAWSDIPLAHTLRQGTYRLRAYTNWMRNAGSSSFYDEQVLIGGEDKKVAVAVAGEQPDVQFFPEGGYLVDGVRSLVAFKAINSQGLGIDVKGTITDNDGNVVADFSSQHLGMGEFALTPQAGKTYTARISVGETGFNIMLPKAQEAGYTLAINNSRSDSLFIKVAVNDQQYNNFKDSLFYIIAQSNGKVYYTGEGRLKKQVYIASVEKSRFPTGIAQFTLFSQSGSPMAERITFIQGNDTLRLQLNNITTVQTARQQVKINLAATNNSGSPATGSFSVSVANETEEGATASAANTIESYLLLSSEVKGYIEQPGYYFTDVNEQTKADLDVLMLTQGYRRFDWKTMLKDTAKQMQYQPERSLTVTGEVTLNAGKRPGGIKINLLANKQNILRDTLTDENGRFSFPDLPLTDTVSILLKARKANNDDRVTISVDQPTYPEIAKANWPVLMVTADTAVMSSRVKQYKDNQRQDYLKNGIRLKEVNIKGYRQPKKPDLSQSSNLHGGGNADQVIMGDQLRPSIDLAGGLLGITRGVDFSESGVALNVRYNRRKMVVIVDGNILPPEYLNEIQPSEVYSIEVLRSAFAMSVYGTSISPNGEAGALVITLKHGSESSPNNNLTARGTTLFPFVGYCKARIFYSPKYNGPKTDKQPTDNRTAIYWNPNIVTDENGKASFEYFNADTKGTYRIEVEGIDDNGNLGRAVYRYKVE